MMKGKRGHLVLLVLLASLITACGDAVPVAQPAEIIPAQETTQALNKEAVQLDMNAVQQQPIADASGPAEKTPDTEEKETVKVPAESSTSQEPKPKLPPVVGDQLPPIYRQFIEAEIGLKDKEKVVDFVVEDIDQDGYEEAVVAVGYDKSYFSQIYLLQNREGSIVNVGADGLQTGGYGAYEIDLIQLEDRPEKVIYTGLSNDANMIGLRLDGYKNGTITTLAYSASPTGAGLDELLDSDKNGRFDGFTQNRWSYDVLYYELVRVFKLNNGDFELERVDVELPDYPTKPKDVVIAYLTLLILDEGKSPDMSSRLKELCQDCSLELYMGDTLAQELYSFLTYDEEAIDVQVQEEALSAKVELTWKEESTRNNRLSFELIKSEDRWRIQSVQSGKVE
jgi:hypothetical protein